MRATNYARATYQEVYDIMTRDGKVSIFGFHTPTGDAPYNMLHGFFTQFRKYKYSGMKVNIIPAAQLPADPLQISYEAGTESYIDPRDLQNPVLFHGAHGNNLGEVLNMIYSDRGFNFSAPSVDETVTDVSDGDGTSWTFEQWYYASMLDPSFRKFNVMNNMALPFMSPRVHNLAVDMAIQPAYSTPESFTEYEPNIGNSSAYLGNFRYVNPFVPTGEENGTDNQIQYVGINPKVMTNRLMKLGWQDTFTMAKSPTGSGGTSTKQYPTVSPLPRIMMGALIMPPSYRTKLAFRIVISHFFEFARFNTSITPTLIERAVTIGSQSNSNYHNFLPESLTSSASYMETDSIDSIDGDVVQSMSGVV